jgi:hypothetical protein
MAIYESAGYESCQWENLTSWAIDLLEEKLTALRYYRGILAQVYGERELHEMQLALKSCQHEYQEGHILPGLLMARSGN